MTIKATEFLKLMESSSSWDHDINYREDPLSYTVTEDCTGMYTCNPYKEELLSIWKFVTSESALKSSKDIYDYFNDCLEKHDFIGADMARKYLQAGATRPAIPAQSQGFFANYFLRAIGDFRFLELKEAFLDNQELKREGNEKR